MPGGGLWPGCHGYLLAAVETAVSSGGGLWLGCHGDLFAAEEIATSSVACFLYGNYPSMLQMDYSLTNDNDASWFITGPDVSVHTHTSQWLCCWKFSVS